MPWIGQMASIRAAYLGAGRAGKWSGKDFPYRRGGGYLAGADRRLQNRWNARLSLPQILFPQDAILARIDTDAVELTDWYEFRPDDRARRALSLTAALGTGAVLNILIRFLRRSPARHRRRFYFWLSPPAVRRVANLTC